MAWYSTRNRIRFLLVIGAALIGLRVFGLYLYPLWIERDEREGRVQARLKAQDQRTVEVTQSYTLRWSESGDQPALQLVIPVADLGLWRQVQHPVLSETGDGPKQLHLEMPVPGADGLTLNSFGSECILRDPPATTQTELSGCPIELGRVELHRDLYPMRPGLQEYLLGGARPPSGRPGGPQANEGSRPVAFWVRTEVSSGGGNRGSDVEVWHFLGGDCSGGDATEPLMELTPGGSGAPSDARQGCYAPPNMLAKYFPGRLNLRRVHALDHCGDRRRHGGCSIEFLYRGRPVKVYSILPGALAVTAALDLLERLARDTASPPTAAKGLARAERAMTDCRLADELMALHKKTAWLSGKYETVRRHQCGLAVQLAASELEKSPESAARIMLEAMVDRGYRAVGRDADWERWYAQDLLAALTRIGQAESVDAVRAHSLRMRSHTLPAEERAESYTALRTVAPRVLGTHLHLLPTIESQLGNHIVQQREERGHLVDFLRATLEHTERELGADSDAAFRVRYAYCRHRMWDHVEPATLGRCADALMDQWSHRSPTLPNLHESIPPIDLGLYITYMLRKCEAVAGQDCSPALIQPRLDVVRRLLVQVPGAAQNEQVRRELGELPVAPTPAEGSAEAGVRASDAQADESTR